ncbi:malignant fibrous histiocytoma-amplified sequence 1 homolog [Branchiostoma lanceolatum]|uniref:malignant fibrous histiocytoma-amplified sequence 1 homolog n=1 Tax=Branchiostoma lanceolatum TaxID=7740 RepID=UPI0034549C79
MASTSSFTDKVKPKEWDIMGKKTLSTLDLSMKNLNQLPKELFELKELEALDLTGNRNIDVSNELIKLTNLKLLCLDDCGLKTVPAVVTKIPQVKTLILGKNKNITLPDEISTLISLTTLVLRDCNLDTLPPVVLKLSNLRELDLSDNPISLPDEMCRLSKLKVLKLDNCNLTTVPPAVLKLPQLEELDLSGNRRIHLPDELTGLTNIRVLKLRRTGMVTVPPVVWRLTQLERLELYCNPIQTLPAEVEQLIYMKHLGLPDCQLRTLPPELWRLTQLERLDLSGNPLQMLPAEIGQLTNVKQLYLCMCELYTLPPEVWRLTRLEELDLSWNPLQTLPAEIGQITNVKHLNLSGCQLHTLPPEVWILAQLEWLDLSHNALQTLPAGVSQLTSVKHLDLSQCPWLRTLPPDLGQLPQLEWLDMNHNPLQTLPAEVGQLTNMKHLNLLDCHLHTLPQEVWRLTQLEELDLSDNSLQTLPVGIGQLYNVKYLRLSNCELQKLPSEVGKLTKLERLDLSSNPLLTSLPVEVGQLTSIKYLDLSGCKLHTIQSEVWRLTQLEELNLSSNPLQALPAAVGQLTNVRHLNLSHCYLRTLPPEVWRLIPLERVDLRSNPLQTLPAEVGQLTNVKHLDMSYCSLRTLPPEVGRLTQLEWLELSFNPLQTLPAEAGQLTSIERLDLSHCQLHTLPAEVGRLTQLEWLELSYNPLQTLPAEVGQLTNVKHLDLSHCQLHTLPAEVGRLTQLEWLDLSSNPLQTLPAEIGQLINVEQLDLSDCQLHTLPPEVGRLTQLEWLDLSSNPLQTLPAEVGQLNSLSSLKVHGNPLIKPPAEICNEGVGAIREYFEEIGRSTEDASIRLKVAVLGQMTAGKTSLVRTLLSGAPNLTWPEDRTHCVEITQWAPDDNITFEVYDFGGHDVYHLTNQFFFTQGTLNLLTVNLQAYNCTAQSYTTDVGFWLDTLNARVPGAMVTIVCSKTDMCSDIEIKQRTRDIRERFTQQHDIWKRTIKQEIKKLENAVVAKEGADHWEVRQQLERTRQLLTRQLRLTGVFCFSSAEPTSGLDTLWNHILESANKAELFPILRRVLPRTWVEFEQQLRDLRDKGTGEYESAKSTSHDNPIREQSQKTNWLTREECLQQGQLAGLTADRLEPVLSYLQHVGTILRYTDIPEVEECVFHDPPALIENFKDLFHHDVDILFSRADPKLENFTSAQKDSIKIDLRDRGLIQKDLMTCLLQTNTNHDIVTALMQHFGLCFEIQSDEKTAPGGYIIPWYLPKQMPGELNSVWPEDIQEEQEQLQLMCDIRGFCPRGLFQRFSVGIHPLIKDRTDWKDGVTAFRQGYRIMVCSKPVADDTYITMATRGSLDQADEMWGVVQPLLKVLVQLLQEWPGVLYSLHVTCAHCIKAGLDNPHQYDLRDRAADDGRHVRCPRVEHKASTSADLVYRLSEFDASSWPQAQSQYRVFESGADIDRDDQEEEVLGSLIETVQTQQASKADTGNLKDELGLLRWQLTELTIDDDAHDENYIKLVAHVSELGLTFRAEVLGDGNCMFHAVSDQVLRTEGTNISHLQLREQAVDHLRRNPCNSRGEHLSDFIPNQSWEEYLDTMSRDGTWGDHVVLQAMADMLGHDVTIVSSVEADNYVTVLHPQSGFPPRAARSLLLGHYAENHYASLDEQALHAAGTVSSYATTPEPCSEPTATVPVESSTPATFYVDQLEPENKVDMERDSGQAPHGRETAGTVSSYATTPEPCSEPTATVPVESSTPATFYVDQLEPENKVDMERDTGQAPHGRETGEYADRYF